MRFRTTPRRRGERRAPWGKETKIWPIESVLRAEVQSGGDSTYRVALILTSGAAEPLTIAYSSGESSKARAVAAINAALAAS